MAEYNMYIFEDVVINTMGKITFAYINATYTEKSGQTMPDSFSTAPSVWVANRYGKNSSGQITVANSIYVSTKDVDSFTVSMNTKQKTAVNNYYTLEIKEEI